MLHMNLCNPALVGIALAAGHPPVGGEHTAQYAGVIDHSCQKQDGAPFSTLLKAVSRIKSVTKCRNRPDDTGEGGGGFGRLNSVWQKNLRRLIQVVDSHPLSLCRCT